MDSKTESPSATTETLRPPPEPERATRADIRALAATTALFGVGVAASLLVQLALPPVAALALAVVAGTGLALVASPRLAPAWVGGLAWLAVCAAITVAVLQLAETRQNNLALGLVMAATGAALPCLNWLRLRMAEGAPWMDTVSEAARVFTEPTTGWAAALVGAGVSLPLVGAYAPLTYDPDSAWFVTSTQHVRNNGIDLLRETQDVFLPHLTIGPLLDLGGYQAAIAFMILTAIALSALTGYLGYRLTGRGSGALVAVVTLLAIPSMPDRADRLPMYAAVFAFAYGAGWLLHRAMGNPERSIWLPVAAGVGFVLAYEAHGVGQVFLLVPFLLLLLHPWHRARRPFLVSLVTIGVLSIPRVVVNLSTDGLQNFRTNYADFTVQKALPVINRDFWGHNNDTTPLGYVTNLPGMAQEALGSRAMLLLVAIPIVLAGLRAGRRARLFVIVSAGIFLTALAVNSPATFGRYLTPLGVGLALVVAVGVAIALRGEGELQLVGRILVVVLSFAAFFQVVDTVSTKVTSRENIVHGPWPRLAAAVDDDRRVTGVRPHQLLWADPAIRTIYGRTMTEEDWVTFLSWPSDQEVTEMMDRNDIGWVYIMPDLRMEIDYHQSWVEPFHDLTVNHAESIMESDRFCLVTEDTGYLLYRYGSCQPGDLRTIPEDVTEEFYDFDEFFGREDDRDELPVEAPDTADDATDEGSEDETSDEDDTDLVPSDSDVPPGEQAPLEESEGPVQ